MFSISLCAATSEPASRINKFLASGLTDLSIEFEGNSFEFFGIVEEKKLNCLSHKMEGNRLSIFASEGSKQSSKLVGYADVEWDVSVRSMEPMVRIWLPPGQKVFPPSDNGQDSQFQSAGYQSGGTSFRGIYRSLDGKIKKEVFGRGLPSGRLEISGKDSEKVYLRLLW